MTQRTRTQTYQASKDPIGDLELVTYEGQDPKRKMYRKGYENYLNTLPVIKNLRDFTKSKKILGELADILPSAQWIKDIQPDQGKFWRTILAMEEPYMLVDDTNLHEGVEIIVAHWGEGFTSPIHGHAPGLLYEHMISGKLRVNTYRLVDPKFGVVRPVETKIYSGNDSIVAAYTNAGKYFKREGYIHSFTALETSHSIHFVPEHTRDGRDNTFEVEYFEEELSLPILEDQLHRIEMREAITMPIGSVVLVRSEMVPDYGDHFMIVTGPPIKKPWGDLIPEDKAIFAPSTSSILDKYPKHNGRTILKLSTGATEAFYKFHNIQIIDGEVVFPDATELLS